MDIKKVKNMVRVGQIVRRKDHDQKLQFDWDPAMTREMQKDERGRVYALCIDGKIEKLGGSQAKGGIKGTYDAYFSGFAKGMSARTYCVWNHICRAIDAGKKVEVYAVWAPLVTVTIPTMHGTETKEMPVDFHTIEEAFVKSFVEKEGRHPFLNMQESGKKWEDTGLLEGYPGLWVPK
jgi:hypothetical protein